MKRILVSAIVLFGFIFSTTATDLAKVDGLSASGKYKEELKVLEKLSNENPKDVEVLWRLARSHFDIADQTEDEDVHKAHFYPGFESATLALKLDPNSAKANHWYAVLSGKIGMLEGTKQKIINSYDVKKYALRAIELDPAYDGTYHVMGRWHYELANLSWIERKIAGLVYETPPDGSFKESSQFFRKAIDAKSDEIRHYVWLAKALIEMEKEADAKKVLNDALELKPFDDGDRMLQKEARSMLRDL